MNPHRPEHLELCAGLVLDALDDAERVALEAHRAAGCAECEREIVRLAEAARLLAGAAAPAPPPPGLKARTLAAAAGEPRSRVLPLPAPRRRSWGPWALAAAAGLLAVTTLGQWREAGRLRGQLDETRRRLADSEGRLAEERRWTAVLDALDARPVSLAPTPDGAPGLRGRGTWDPATRRAVIVFEGVNAPAGRDYELWGLHPAGPRSLGLLRADSSGRAIVRIEDAGDPASLQAFAISLEPAGGSPNPASPTGPVVMVGKVAS